MDCFAHFPSSDVDGVFLVDVRAIVVYILHSVDAFLYNGLPYPVDK